MSVFTSPPPGGKTQFDFGSVDNGEHQGFDASVSPRWQMVPDGVPRIVVLNEGQWLTVESSDNTYLRVTDQMDHPSLWACKNRIFLLEPLRTGFCPVYAKYKKTVIERLDVHVLPRRTVRVAFTFVSDKAGHTTRRSPAEVEKMLKSANDILVPRANVQLQSFRTQNVRIDSDLGTVIFKARDGNDGTGAPRANDESNLIFRHKDQEADFNVFFVWELHGDDVPPGHDGQAWTCPPEKCCLFEDDMGSDDPGWVLAHEFGHACGIKHSDNPKDLMNGMGVCSGAALPKEHVRRMNPFYG